jgi:hypothetical protein
VALGRDSPPGADRRGKIPLVKRFVRLLRRLRAISSYAAFELIDNVKEGLVGSYVSATPLIYLECVEREHAWLSSSLGDAYPWAL